MFNLMTKKATVAGEQKRFKLIHVLLPHPRLIYDKECKRVELKEGITNRMTQQSMCALKKLNELFDKYKQSGIYDSSLIVVVSDHGSRMNIDKSITGFPSYFEMNSSKVLFMIKGMNQKGKFMDVDNPVSLINLYDLFIDENQHESKISYLRDNNRLFYSFKNEDNLNNGYLADAPLYNVGKNSHDTASWDLIKLVIHDCPKQKIPMIVKFTKDGREKYCAKFGFSRPRTNKSGIWTESKDVRILLKLDLFNKDSDALIDFNINFKPFIKAKQKFLKIDWYINNELISSQKLNSSHSIKTQLSIPVKILKKKEYTELKIIISNLISQKEMGLNSDSRKLGLLIKSIEIE